MRLKIYILTLITVILCLSQSALANEGYRIYISVTSGNYSGVSPIDCGPVLTKTVSGISPGTYYAVATAYAGSNESVYSNEVSFTLTQSGSITFAWDASPGVIIPNTPFMVTRK